MGIIGVFSSIYLIDVNSKCAGCVPDWCSGGRVFEAPVWHNSFDEIDHKAFSAVILSLLLIQEEKLSIACERMRNEY